MVETGNERDLVELRTTHDIGHFKWPAFVNSDEANFLVWRVNIAANNEAERRVFMAILRCAYENVMELEILYRELPGIFAGQHEAMDNFCKILNRAKARGTIAKDRGFTSNLRLNDIPSPESLAGWPCRPQFLIKPYIVRLIGHGIDRMARGQQAVYDGYMSTLRGLWERATPLERLNGKAVRGAEADGRDRLAEDLRLIARDSRVGGQLSEAELFSRPGSYGSMSRPLQEEATGDIPEPASLWPPPSGDVPIGWLPDFGSDLEFPNNICEQLEALCRSVIIDAGMLPTSASAGGIESIDPRFACPGQSLTIRGSGFGNSQPSQVNVVIGDLVAEVVSWTDTAIVITVPANATSGCIGFRDEFREGDRRRLHRENQVLMDAANKGLRCLDEPTSWPHLPDVPDIPPCTGTI